MYRTTPGKPPLPAGCRSPHPHPEVRQVAQFQRLPTWGTTLGKRITAYPKVHIIDSGLAVGEILKQVSWSEEAVTAAYFRTQSGDEVDLVLETWDGRVVGFEVKAGSRVQDADLSGLRLLRDRLGARFTAGFLLNLGELAYRKEDRIMVMPLSGLWSLATRQTSGQRLACTAVIP
jgi:predicted AAA+ superfamily ATPase